MKEGTSVKNRKSHSGAQPGMKEKKKVKSDDFKSSTISEAPEESVNKRKRDSTKEDSRKSKKKQKKESKTKEGQEELEIDINAPNPLSKKALRLQKKGKPVLTASQQPNPKQSTPATNIDTTHPDRNKLLKARLEAEFSVWIGNLSYKSDVKALRGWLVRGDKRITDKEMTRINLPLNANGRSKGFAYVDLLTEEAMEKVISRSEEMLDGRRLLIKNGKDFKGRPEKKTPRYHAESSAKVSISDHCKGVLEFNPHEESC